MREEKGPRGGGGWGRRGPAASSRLWRTLLASSSVPHISSTDSLLCGYPLLGRSDQDHGREAGNEERYCAPSRRISASGRSTKVVLFHTLHAIGQCAVCPKNPGRGDLEGVVRPRARKGRQNGEKCRDVLLHACGRRGGRLRRHCGGCRLAHRRISRDNHLDIKVHFTRSTLQ